MNLIGTLTHIIQKARAAKAAATPVMARVTAPSTTVQVVAYEVPVTAAAVPTFHEYPAL